MSTFLQPYLGTDLSELLAGRRTQDFESALKQQEATAPVLAQTLAPFLSLAMTQEGGLQNLQQMLGAAGIRMPFAGTQTTGTGGMGALGGLIQSPEQQPAQQLFSGTGVEPNLMKQAILAKAFPGLGTQITKQQERVSNQLADVNQVESVMPQIKSNFNELQTSLKTAGIDIGRAVADFTALPASWLEGTGSFATREQLSRMYNQLMQSPLSGMDKAQPLDAESLKRPAQMQAVLKSLEYQVEFQDYVTKIIRNYNQIAQAEGRVISEDEIAQAKSLASKFANLRIQEKRSQTN